jgi:hypothetical protein
MSNGAHLRSLIARVADDALDEAEWSNPAS